MKVFVTDDPSIKSLKPRDCCGISFKLQEEERSICITQEAVKHWHMEEENFNTADLKALNDENHKPHVVFSNALAE